MEKLEARLRKRGLSEATQEKYREIVEQAGQETPDLLDWLQRHVRSSMPVGTILPLRAAVKHYLLSEQGYREDELEALLPPARGVSPQVTPPLSPEQLAVYHAAVGALPEGSVKSILAILPGTGLRIGEACALRTEHLHGDRLVLTPQRVVPLSQSAATHLNRLQPTSEWLFSGRGGGPITDHAVRVYTRDLRDKHPELGESFSPQVLRSTYAVMMLKRGVELEALQRVLGHTSIMSTQRYLSLL